ncbi:hypothetical protein BDF19DRAFT_443968 [Syncephalis fuscata]|nr:hypothetical protein BDF19DRAFT_443968 [Syncephalis fuscata]
MKLTLSSIAKFATVLAVLAVSVDARPSGPQTPSIQRRPPSKRGDECDKGDSTEFPCPAGSKCDTMLGANVKICLLVSTLNGECNHENAKCADGFTCDIKPGHPTGICIAGFGPTTGHRPSPPSDPVPASTASPVSGGTQVGHSQACGNVNGGLFTCTPHMGLVCASISAGKPTTCLLSVAVGGKCNNENTICVSGSSCSVPDLQYYGTCVASAKRRSLNRRGNDEDIPGHNNDIVDQNDAIADDMDDMDEEVI